MTSPTPGGTSALTAATYQTAGRDQSFQAELGDLLEHYAGRATPLYEAKRLSSKLGGAHIP